MLEKKEKVIRRLEKLREVQFYEPTALELHAKRPLMHRVQRQEDRLYRQRIGEQQKVFQLKLKKIEKYYTDLQSEEQRRLKLLKEWKKKKGLILEPVFQPIETVVPEPKIGISKMPIQVRTRLHSRGRAKGLSRLR